MNTKPHIVTDNNYNKFPTVVKVSTGYLTRFNEQQYKVTTGYNSGKKVAVSTSTTSGDEEMVSTLDYPYNSLVTVGHIAECSVQGGKFFNELLQEREAFNALVKYNKDHHIQFARKVLPDPNFDVQDIISLVRDGKCESPRVEILLKSKMTDEVVSTLRMSGHALYLETGDKVNYITIPEMSSLDKTDANLIANTLMSYSFYILAALHDIDLIELKTTQVLAGIWNQSKHVNTQSMDLF